MKIHKSIATTQFQPITLTFKLESLSEVKAMFALFSYEDAKILLGISNTELVKSLLHADTLNERESMDEIYCSNFYKPSKEGLTTI